MSLRQEQEQRRTELRHRRPTSYCTRCMSVAYVEDPHCLTCRVLRPISGWQDLEFSHDPFLGRELDGRYLVTQFIGYGSSGSVYRIESLTIFRDFAVKIVDVQPLTKEGAEHPRLRLEREIRALSRLRNPHIVPIYEVIEFQGHSLGLVMDYVPGETLARKVRRQGTLPLDLTFDIVRQISNGLHEAHQAGMVHRDLKPENIMVDRLPLGDPFALVLDFGIVHCRDDVRTTQGFVGTPNFASPEQIRSGEIDHRSDIYSLGAIFHYALTGQPLFSAPHPYQVLLQHLHNTPPLISQTVPQRGFPTPLVDLIDRMLSKNPDHRPATLGAVVAEIDRMKSGFMAETCDWPVAMTDKTFNVWDSVDYLPRDKELPWDFKKTSSIPRDPRLKNRDRDLPTGDTGSFSLTTGSLRAVESVGGETLNAANFTRFNAEETKRSRAKPSAANQSSTPAAAVLRRRTTGSLKAVGVGDLQARTRKAS